MQSYMCHEFGDTSEASTDMNATHEEMDRARVVARARAKAAAKARARAPKPRGLGRAKAAAPARARAPRAAAGHEEMIDHLKPRLLP